MPVGIIVQVQWEKRSEEPHGLPTTYTGDEFLFRDYTNLRLQLSSRMIITIYINLHELKTQDTFSLTITFQ